MKLRDIADRVTLDQRKLTDYALNPHNERGQHKARVFEQVLGLTLENYTALLRLLESQALNGPAEIIREDRFGRHVRVDIEVTGLTGQVAVIRTGWLIPPDSREALLVTLFVRR
jgi:hypothetical protein